MERYTDEVQSLYLNYPFPSNFPLFSIWQKTIFISRERFDLDFLGQLTKPYIRAFHCVLVTRLCIIVLKYATFKIGKKFLAETCFDIKISYSSQFDDVMRQFST
jgi:hypothetical protein